MSEEDETIEKILDLFQKSRLSSEKRQVELNRTN